MHSRASNAFWLWSCHLCEGDEVCFTAGLLQMLQTVACNAQVPLRCQLDCFVLVPGKGDIGAFIRAQPSEM